MRRDFIDISRADLPEKRQFSHHSLNQPAVARGPIRWEDGRNSGRFHGFNRDRHGPERFALGQLVAISQLGRKTN
jgi:hypothetical protein